MSAKPLIIKSLVANDVRFPTSLQGDGSDAMHFDPDYSCVYIRIYLDSNDTVGHGHTFTIGRGTEVVKQAVLALAPLVIGRDLQADIRSNWAAFWRRLTSDSQLRWIGPEKGALHLATGAVVNALWDLVAKLEEKPLWKLLVDMTPEEIVDVIDFRYITDALSKEDAIKLLKTARPESAKREAVLRAEGYPAYTTGVGWTDYCEEKRRRLCREAVADGYSRFKAKVGSPTVAEDRERLRIIREEVGPEALLAVDANQKWDVEEAIRVMKQLTDFNLLWIEEPTSPDDVLGHLAVSKALAPLGIGVASGEQCANRILFKQFLASGALQFCQIDACRVGGVNEVMAIILLAARFKVPVCPHAGGVGLCELVQHLAMWDYVSVGGSFEKRMIEFVPHLSEHFYYPAVCRRGRYVAPTVAGYGGQMKESSIKRYEFPNGEYWSGVLKEKKK